MNNKQTVVVVACLVIAVAIFFVYWNNDRAISATEYKPEYRTSQGTLFKGYTYDANALNKPKFEQDKREQLNKNTSFLVFGLLGTIVVGAVLYSKTKDS